ncbi:MAG: acyltransferase [Lachnospiraceae bacterium]|nr:acyltransferase [Lachnospiraceae bacterium]
MIFILFVWIAMLFRGMKHNDVKECTAFTKKNTAALRGICSVEIMLGHIGLATESIVLFPNRKAGILFVGIFFALSGYGLMYGVSNKENYLQGFWKRRFPKILVPAYFVFVVGIAIENYNGGNLNNLVNVVNLRVFFEHTNWYVWELLVMYIVFYICARLDKSLLKGQYILLAFSLVFVCIAFEMGVDNPWYGSTLCFWLGIFYYMKSEVFIRFSEKYFLGKIIIGIVFLGIFCMLFFMQEGILGNLVARNGASLIFTILVIMWLHQFSIGNIISVWLGKYSYEIFLFHPLLISILRPWVKNDVFYAVMVIAGTILAAFIYRNCANSMKGLFKRQELRG